MVSHTSIIKNTISSYNCITMNTHNINFSTAVGLSDPFCTLYLNPKQKHNTSMKPENLNPVWREYFSL